MPKAPTKPPPPIVKPFPWSSRSAFDDAWPTLPTSAVMMSPSLETSIGRVRVGSVSSGSENFQA
jgi:hypothetical protein